MESNDLINQTQQGAGSKNLRLLSRSLATAAMAGSLLLAAPSAFSAVITTGNKGGCTLADAIDAANADADSGTCTSAVDGGVVGAYGADTIILSGKAELTAPLADITDDLVLDGDGNSVARNNGSPEFRVFTVTGGITVQFKDLEVSGGDLTLAMGEGGGIHCDDSGNTLTLTNVNINNNFAHTGGGLFTECETLIEKGSSISSNTALDLPAGMTPTDGEGGGIYMSSLATGPLTIEDSVVNNNTSKIGGGGIVMDGDGGSTGKLTVSLSTVNNNRAAGDGPGGEEGAFGGGIAIFDQEVEIANSTINNNRVTDDDGTTDETRGGGILIVDSTFGTNLLVDSIVNNNSAAYLGGGIALDDSLLVIESSKVSNNSAELGGGIATFNGTGVTLEESEVSGNTATVNGGGVFASNSAGATIEDSTISGNSATTGNGGGLAIIYAAPIPSLGASASSGALISTSTLSGNSSAINGGGIYNDSGTVLGTSNTISGNSSGTGGAGFHTLGDAAAGSTDLGDSTIASNVSTSGGGGFDLTDNGPGASTTLAGSLLANNTSSNCNPSLGGGAAVTFATSVSDDASCATVGTGLGAAADPVNLQPLADNGGFTQTHALPCNDATAAVDSGDAAGATDQRGVARPVDCGGAAEDTGAFEAGGTYIDLANNGATSTTVAAGATNVVMLDIALTPRHGDVILDSLEGSYCAPGHPLDLQQLTVVEDVDGSGSLTPGDTTLGTRVNPTDENRFSITINMGDPTILENVTKNVLVLANFDTEMDQALAPSSWTQAAFAGPLGQTALLNSRAAQLAMLITGLLLVASFLFQGALLRKVRIALLASFLGIAMTACSDGNNSNGNDKIGQTPAVVVGENGMTKATSLLQSFCLQLEEVSTTTGQITSNLPVLGATVKVNN